MIKEWIVSKEVRDVKAARWEGFRRLAMRLPDRHVLAIELIRTRHDETAAVFTVVRDGRPVQHVVLGDAQGRVKPGQCPPHRGDDHGQGGKPVTSRSLDASAAAPHASPPPHAEPAASPGIAREDDGGAAMPDSIALGEPPVSQPPSPGLVALAGTLLPAAFDLGEVVTDA